MTKIIYSFLFFFSFLIFSTSTFAQDVYVRGSGDRQGYYRTRPDGDCSNNYSSAGNTNPYNGKVGYKPCGDNTVRERGGPGTGEYFLVPAIIRKDPIGTAIRFNTCGTALMQLYDKGTIYALTDKAVQNFTPKVALETAEDRFRVAIRFNDKNYIYYANLAAVLFRQRKMDEALENIVKARELNPNDPVLQQYEDKIRGEKITVKILNDDGN